MPGLGSRIREIRESRGLKQAAFARQLGVAPQTLSNYELGPNRVPADMVPAIAAALNVTICELYGVEEGHAFDAAHVEPTGTERADPPNLIFISSKDHRELGRLDAATFESAVMAILMLANAEERAATENPDFVPRASLQELRNELVHPISRPGARWAGRLAEEVAGLPAPDQEFVRQMAEALQGYRAQLLAEEGAPADEPLTDPNMRSTT